MNVKNSIYLLLLLMLIPFGGKSQDIEGGRFWYSTYLYKKINSRWFADAYLLNSFNVDDHSFAFNQNDFTINYKLNRKVSIHGGYSFSFFKWFPSYENRYPQQVSPFGTITFHKFSTGITHKFKYRDLPFRFKQDLVAQYFTPKLEKYQFRFLYKFKTTYVNKNLPLNLRPFAQLFLYYYHGGTPIFYFDDEGEEDRYASPNGLHRFRIKSGVSFKPFEKHKFFSVVLYYALNKEFNIDGLGNELNHKRPIDAEDPGRFRQITDVPFNNYSILGFQLNFIFN